MDDHETSPEGTLIRLFQFMASPDMGYDIREHEHGSGRWGYSHTHAHGSVMHSHSMQAICTRPECDGMPTHNIHPKPHEWSN